jgi:hypothetical protein
VGKSAQRSSDGPSIIEQPIGDDPEALRSLNPELDIWDAYETIHLLMPDGSMKLGGEAVTEVLRNLRNTKWFAWIFRVSVFGCRPFQLGVGSTQNSLPFLSNRKMSYCCVIRHTSAIHQTEV